LLGIKITHVNCDSHSEVASVYYYNQLVNPKFFYGKWIPPGGAARYFGRSHGDNYVEFCSEDLHTKGSLDIKYDQKGVLQ